MHRLGVRGIRLNLRTRSERFEKVTFAKVLQKYADKIRPLGWVIQLYIDLDQIGLIADTLAKLGVPIVFDHLGSPKENAPARTQTGCTQLLNLLSERKAWVKMSGIYRFANLPDVDEWAREILRTAPTQVVWASDWPHSGGVEKNPGGDRNQVQEYRKIDIPKFIARCKAWCNHDENLMRRIWVDNPRILWQYDSQDMHRGIDKEYRSKL